METFEKLLMTLLRETKLDRHIIFEDQYGLEETLGPVVS